MMKAAIFNPYLDTLGGGERYTLAFAKVLSGAGYSVDLEWRDLKIRERLEQRFGFDLSNINVISSINRGDGYDLCFWVSDGSIPTLRARKNLLHFQVPFHDVDGKSLLNKMKLFRIGKIICNSNFTKRIIDNEFGVKSIVIYPPVDTKSLKPGKKENLILSVGRFSQLKQSKRQDLLIAAFKKIFDSGGHDWKLVIAGGIEVGAGNVVGKIEKEARGYPIKIIKSPSFKELKKIYGAAKIFWSASGFGENEDLMPEKVEHFGIAVVEGMSAGAVPVVFNAGGHREIIESGESGFLWNDPSGLISKTTRLIDDKSIWKKMSLTARKKAYNFGYDRFEESVLRII